MRMPTRLKSGAHEYRIVREKAPTNKGRRVSGLCDTDSLTILIETSLKRSKAQEILLHEICHITTEGTDVPIEAEEKLVDLIAKGLLQILQDNPKLVQFSAEK